MSQTFTILAEIQTSTGTIRQGWKGQPEARVEEIRQEIRTHVPLGGSHITNVFAEPVEMTQVVRAMGQNGDWSKVIRNAAQR